MLRAVVWCGDKGGRKTKHTIRSDVDDGPTDEAADTNFHNQKNRRTETTDEDRRMEEQKRRTGEPENDTVTLLSIASWYGGVDFRGGTIQLA